MSIKIYVEGGGNQDSGRTLCQKGFSQYFAKIVPGRRPRVVSARSRKEAYDDFCTALKSGGGGYDLLLLLVDSEDPVQDGHTAWQHLKNRQGDGWDKPEGADENQVYLMVQCMESWFLADKDALVGFYGQGFLVNALPANPDIEAVRKADVASALNHATKPTRTKGQYHKVDHGFAILGLINPQKVAAISPHAAALHGVITSQA